MKEIKKFEVSLEHTRPFLDEPLVINFQHFWSRTRAGPVPGLRTLTRFALRPVSM